MGMRTLPRVWQHIFCLCGEWEPEFVPLLSLVYYFQKSSWNVFMFKKRQRQAANSLTLFEAKDRQTRTPLFIDASLMWRYHDSALFFQKRGAYTIHCLHNTCKNQKDTILNRAPQLGMHYSNSNSTGRRMAFLTEWLLLT